MAGKTIKVTIPLTGISKGERKPTFETAGFVGTACRDATTAFEQAMGAATEEEVKSEMYDTEVRHEHLNQ